jgi:hypothetical protein
MERNVVILLPYLLPSGRNKKRGILADGQPVIKSREVALLMNSAPKARAMLGIRALQGALRTSSQRLLITSTKRMHTPALCGTWEIDIFFPSRYDWTTGVNCRRPVPEAWIRQGDLIQGGWGGLAEISLICSRGQIEPASVSQGWRVIGGAIYAMQLFLRLPCQSMTNTTDGGFSPGHSTSSRVSGAQLTLPCRWRTITNELFIDTNSFQVLNL